MTVYIANHNPKTKKDLKALIESGKKLNPLQIDISGDKLIEHAGKFAISGPRYPEPHKWYAEVVTDANGYIVKVK